VTNLATVSLEAPVPRGKCTSTPKGEWRDTPAMLAFASLLANPGLKDFDKVLLTILANYCRADFNAIAFPSSIELAERAGVSGVKDGGEARVNKSLARLERMGIIDRIAWYDLNEFLATVGKPRLGIVDPRDEKNANARRYILLWWKVPGLVDGLAIAMPNTRRPARARAPVDECVHDAGDTRRMSPAPAGRMSPAPAFRTSSKFERSNGTEENVTAAPPPGEIRTRAETTKPLPSPAELKRWLDDLNSPRPFVRTIALASLAEHGAVPPEWVDRVPQFLPAEPERPRPALAPAVQLTPTEQIESRVRRIVDPTRPRPDAQTLDDLAFDVASMIHDRHSIAFHKAVLGEVADGVTPHRDWLSAFRKARDPNEKDPGKRFNSVVKPCRKIGKPIARVGAIGAVGRSPG
jgi:hypothetical protein